jgi:uncharacterized membrane protein
VLTAVSDSTADNDMLFWILIAALIFMLVIAVENYLKAERVREKKIKSVGQRLKLLEKRKDQQKSED